MTRIIAGRAGGRRLQTLKGDRTRPTSDRVREALFSAIEAWLGPLADAEPSGAAGQTLRGLRFLDVYAGSGAVGLEAWSRGADAVTFVESDRRTAGVIQANARSVGAAGSAEVLVRPAGPALATPPEAAYDVVFLDPPYPLTEAALAEDLAHLADHGWLAEDALVVVERSSRGPEPTWPAGLAPLPGRRGRRSYGETVLWFALWYGRAAGSDGGPDHDPPDAPENEE